MTPGGTRRSRGGKTLSIEEVICREPLSVAVAPHHRRTGVLVARVPSAVDSLRMAGTQLEHGDSTHRVTHRNQSSYTELTNDVGNVVCERANRVRSLRLVALSMAAQVDGQRPIPGAREVLDPGREVTPVTCIGRLSRPCWSTSPGSFPKGCRTDCAVSSPRDDVRRVRELGRALVHESAVDRMITSARGALLHYGDRGGTVMAAGKSSRVKP